MVLFNQPKGRTGLSEPDWMEDRFSVSNLPGSSSDYNFFKTFLLEIYSPDILKVKI